MPKVPGISNDSGLGASAPILRALRLKFIAVNMALALIVLTAAFATVLYLDYNSRFNAIISELQVVISDATTTRVPQIATTQRLTNSEKALGMAVGVSDLPGISSPAPSQGTATSSIRKGGGSTSVTTSQDGSSSMPTIGVTAGSDNSIILLAVYSVSPNGIYTTVGDYTNASIPESTILGANDAVLESSKDSGYLQEYNLFYLRQKSSSNPSDYIIAYADGSSMTDWQGLAYTLIVAGLAILGVLFIFNLFFSAWAIRPIRISLKQQQQFTADASHELKTPLTVILANMAILKSQPDSSVEDQMQWVESTQTEAELMQLLVNDMLALSRPEEQKQNVVKEDVDFSDLVEGEVLQFESVAFELGVEIEDDIQEDLHVMGNQERLGRMVATLIDNACKYAESEVNIRLSYTASPSNAYGRAVLTVHNDGNPIPEEDLPYIFQRFYRADKVRTSSKGGYGLGLAIGQEIAHEHDGAITVESTAEAGTTFTATLPLCS